MPKTLILNFHPGFTPSKVNAAMAEAVADLPDVEVVLMAGVANAHGSFDNDAEARRLFDAGRLVLQFPIQWYAPPALLASWQAQVLTYMFYIAPEHGERLSGLPIMVAATAGNVAQAYTPEGINGFPLEELLYPMQSMARRCGLVWHAPHLVFGANALSGPALEAEIGRYRERVAQFASTNALAIA